MFTQEKVSSPTEIVGNRFVILGHQYGRLDLGGEGGLEGPKPTPEEVQVNFATLY